MSYAHVLYVTCPNTHNLTFLKIAEAQCDAAWWYLLLQYWKIFHILLIFTWVTIGRVVTNGVSEFFLGTTTKSFVDNALIIFCVDHWTLIKPFDTLLLIFNTVVKWMDNIFPNHSHSVRIRLIHNYTANIAYGRDCKEWSL